MNNLNLYIETSAINYLAENYIINDAIATKALQSVKGNKWYISTVTLWEILLTTDDMQREKLIAFSQRLCFEHLLKSPSEIIIDYIEHGCPPFSFYKDFHSISPIAAVWNAVCADPKTTFRFNKADLADWTRELKDVSRMMAKIVNGIVFSYHLDKEEERIQGFINIIYNEVLDKHVIIPEAEKIQKLALLFIFYFLCKGIDFPQEPLENFWNKRGGKLVSDRLFYIIENVPSLLQRGPFIKLANMALHQVRLPKKTGRGLFHDSLHCIYLPFVDFFITNDEHFSSLKRTADDNNYKKILNIAADMKFTGKLVKLDDENLQW